MSADGQRPLGSTRACFARLGSFLALALAVGCDSEPQSPPSPSPVDHPSVILISLDTLRADALGCYGYERDTTPVLDAFAKVAVRFDQAIVQSNATPSSHAAMLTGINPMALRLGARFSGKELSLDPSVSSYGYGLLDQFTPSLTKALFDADFRTGGFTAHEGCLGEKNGFDMFFDWFQTGYPTGPENRQRVQTWLEETEVRPLFLFYHNYDVHSDYALLPYEAPTPYRGRYSSWYEREYRPKESNSASEHLQQTYLNDETFDADTARYFRDLYDEGVAFTDAEMGEFFDLLRAHGLWDDALIIVTADHGEEFQEHGGLLHYQLYDEVLRVPLLIKFPQQQYANLVVSSQVRCIDIAPTVLDLLDLPPSDEASGESLLPLIEAASRGESAPDTGGGSFSCGDFSGAFRTRLTKYLADFDKQEFFFDLVQDPHELENLLAESPEKARNSQFAVGRRFEAESKKGERIARQREDAGRTIRHFDEEDIENLRRLGYAVKTESEEGEVSGPPDREGGDK